MADLSFVVRAGLPALPGTLTIEIEAIPKFVQAKNPVIQPPLRSPVLDQPQTAIGSTERPVKQYVSRAWGIDWATPVTRRLNALGGASNVQLLSFEVPSLDTTDMLWYATGTVDALTNPVTITAPLSVATSIYGRTFGVGDYIIWDDPVNVNGKYQYEIDRIISVNGQVFTLSRSQQGQPAQSSYFGAVRAAHTGVKFYRMLDPTFNVLWDGTKQVYQFLWGNMIVSAVLATTVDVDPKLVNLFPVPPTAAALGLAT